MGTPLALNKVKSRSRKVNFCKQTGATSGRKPAPIRFGGRRIAESIPEVSSISGQQKMLQHANFARAFS
jgi:hypothetical protein